MNLATSRSPLLPVMADSQQNGPRQGSLEPSLLRRAGDALMLPTYLAFFAAADGFISIAVHIPALDRWRPLHTFLSLAQGVAALCALLATLPLLLLGTVLRTSSRRRQPYHLECLSGQPETGPIPWPDWRQRLGVVSANVCGMPDGLSRVNRLPGGRKRARAIARLLASAAQAPGTPATGPAAGHRDTSRGPTRRQTGGVIPARTLGDAVVEAFPRETAFVCLQEVLSHEATGIYRHHLRQTFPYIVRMAEAPWMRC